MIGTTDEFAVNFTLKAGHLHPHQESLGLELRTDLSLAGLSFKIRIVSSSACLSRSVFDKHITSVCVSLQDILCIVSIPGTWHSASFD